MAIKGRAGGKCQGPRSEKKSERFEVWELWSGRRLKITTYLFLKPFLRERFIKKKRKKLIKISFRYVRVAENFEKFVFFLSVFPLFSRDI